MTTVEILFQYKTPPTESVSVALAGMRDVYGIRRFVIDQNARTLLVEFDATRLNAATVAKLVRMTSLDISDELPVIPVQPAVVAAPVS